MTLYNVLTPVVSLVQAESPEAALAEHARIIRNSGLEVYPFGAHVYESDEQESRP